MRPSTLLTLLFMHRGLVERDHTRITIVLRKVNYFHGITSKKLIYPSLSKKCQNFNFEVRSNKNGGKFTIYRFYFNMKIVLVSSHPV